MLSNKESSGLRELFQDIEDPVLFSILDTVTKRMFTTPYRERAIQSILSCAAKPSDILKRQKVTKKVLFNYLIRKGVEVYADLDKAALVNKCLQFWGSEEISDVSPKKVQDLTNESRRNDSDNEVEDCGYISDPSSCKNLDLNTQMGLAFTKWFFRILNTLTDFGPEHFWPNCNLTARLDSPFGIKEESRTGSVEVASFLVNLINTDKYYFLAGDSEDSVKFEIDQYGLIKLLNHGVLYQNSNCIGLFDCAFGLVKNPGSSETYKIQFIKMKLKVNSSVQNSLPVNNYPSVCEMP